MDNQLIPVSFRGINDQMIQTVDAREEWRFLDSKQQFGDWIKNRIRQYYFIENVDFTIHKIMKRGKSGAQARKEYYISLDMAKELAMVENNDKGRQIRRYFIECERRLRESGGIVIAKEEYQQIIETTKSDNTQVLNTLDKISDVLERVPVGMNTMANAIDQFDERLHALEKKSVLTGERDSEVEKKGLIGFVEQHLPPDEYRNRLYTDMADDYNNIRNFIHMFCVIEKGPITQVALLYKIYVGWCYKMFMLPLGRNTFYEQLIEVLKGIASVTKKGSKIYMMGIRLRRDIMDPEPKID